MSTSPPPSSKRRVPGGPALVSLGAAGWGAENLFRTRLDRLRLPAYPIVLFEHVLQVIFTLPWLLKNAWLIKRAPRRALVYVFLSGAVGSSLGTACYTAALDTVNPTVAAMLLNLQPVVSTAAGAMLFSERLSERFFLYAALAIGAGVAIAAPTVGDLTHVQIIWHHGLAMVFATIALWGFATAAGRGAMRELPVGLAAPLRLWSGLLTTAFILGVRALAGKNDFALAPFLTGSAITNLVLLASLTGALPLFVYFAGLAKTSASVAGYCEMFYTISATFVGWALLGGTLRPHQLGAAAVLIFAIVQLNRAQRLPNGAAKRAQSRSAVDKAA